MLFPLPAETDLPQAHHLDGNAAGSQKEALASVGARCAGAASHGLQLFPRQNHSKTHAHSVPRDPHFHWCWGKWINCVLVNCAGQLNVTKTK